MPELVEYTYTATSLRENDKLIWRNRQWTVERVERKTKFAYVKVAESLEPFRIELNQNVKMLRMEKTREERLVEAVLFAAKALRDLTRSHLYGLETAKDKLRKALDNDSLYITSWDMESLVMAQEQYALANRFRHGVIARADLCDLDPHDVERVLDKASDEHVIDEYRALGDEVRRELLSKRWSTRGGSTLANAVIDVENDTQRDWLRLVDRYLGAVDAWRSKED